MKHRSLPIQSHQSAFLSKTQRSEVKLEQTMKHKSVIRDVKRKKSLSENAAVTIRAIHLEVTESLETDSFICALCRFISRRGTPKMMRGNNGMNMSSGEREIREALNNWNQ